MTYDRTIPCPLITDSLTIDQAEARLAQIESSFRDSVPHLPDWLREEHVSHLMYVQRIMLMTPLVELAQRFEQKLRGLAVLRPSLNGYALPWSEYGTLTLTVTGSLKDEGEIAIRLHEVIDELDLSAWISFRSRQDADTQSGITWRHYGPASLCLVPDNERCKIVRVGSEMVERPIYKVQCT